MKARPILFSGPMVSALLDGRKTQTRRVVKPQPLRSDWLPYHCPDGRWNWILEGTGMGSGDPFHCLHGRPGDLLWVKENWAQRKDRDHLNGTQLREAGIREAWYWADGPGKCCNTGCDGAAGRVRTARFMPRWASRITLRITDVRVERLQEISEDDAIDEGCKQSEPLGEPWATDQFEELWKSINGPGSWDENPWVWVVQFEVIRANVDQVLQEAS